MESKRNFLINNRGDYELKCLNKSYMVTCFDYTSDLDMFMDEADLVISHAGVGTIIELVSSSTPAIFVINSTLLDNHQAEIADKIIDQQSSMKVPMYFKTTTEKIVEYVRT